MASQSDATDKTVAVERHRRFETTAPPDATTPLSVARSLDLGRHWRRPAASRLANE
jgi:hypothetical protein